MMIPDIILCKIKLENILAVRVFQWLVIVR